jgi:hypothetical protein
MKVLATYTFLPWMRHGLANSIKNSDTDASVKIRPSIEVDLSIEGIEHSDNKVTKNVKQPIQIYGPGDIIGIENRAIIKAEPRTWITNFEPNYFPYIEFYDEDFAWRYTPADKNGNRLRPWISLVVLKDDDNDREFELKKINPKQPLSSFSLRPGIKTSDVFPSYDQLWAWTHVHVNSDLSNPGHNTAPDFVLANLTSVIHEDPDDAYCRILCPRRLEPFKGYRAFLIPSFETGRLAGLGFDIPAATPANQSAWDGTQNDFPFYHNWYFRTGSKGDFEDLVDLLQPKVADERVGIRDMDVIHIGSNLPAITTPADLNGILKLGGALRVPLEFQDLATFKKYDEWDEHPYPHDFEKAMAKRINLEDDYRAKEPSAVNPDGDPDPVITSPLYGRWHSAIERMLYERDGTNSANDHNWLHELNLDPRYRVAAGFGTKVVQKNQEDYMQACWEQIGDVLAINRKILLAQLAKEAAVRLYQKHFLTLDTENKFQFASPLNKRILYNGLTLHAQVEKSLVPRVALSPAFRSLMRPRGAFSKRIPVLTPMRPESFVKQLNDNTIFAAPPKVEPAGVLKYSELAAVTEPLNVPRFIRDLLRKYPWLRFIPLILGLLFLLLLVLTTSALWGVLAAAGISMYIVLNSWSRQIEKTKQFSAPRSEDIDKLPAAKDFVITQPDMLVSPVVNFGGTDSVEASRFKQGLKGAFNVMKVQFPQPVKQVLPINNIVKEITTAINPETIIPKRTLSTIFLPDHIRARLVEQFAPVMNYPKIDFPMYDPLTKISADLFLPNINLVENNSITILETNEKFIESYMVGLNHEMARELLWREYPTDQKGSYFQQFWDVSSVYPGNPAPPDIKAKLRDIKEIHTWPRSSDLGNHNNRRSATDKPPIVLVIKGELLKKYPNTVVYAHKADWGKDKQNIPDSSISRVLVELSDTEEKDPPKSKIKTPIFEAKVDPDIYFFGFDLDAVTAKGGEKTSDDAGWFFVLKERPGEARFGLDEVDEKPGLPPLYNWNILSWEHTGTVAGKCLEINQSFNLVPQPATPNEQDKNNPEDDFAKWNNSTDSAQLAYILYQVPVMVAIHSSRMLKQAKTKL